MAVTAHPARLKTAAPDYLILGTVGVLVVIGCLLYTSPSPRD